MLYNYSLCWKIKRMHVHWYCGQGEESAFEVNLPAVATCSLAGVMGFFQMKQNWRCTSGARWATPAVNGNSVHEKTVELVPSQLLTHMQCDRSILIISAKRSHSTDLLLLRYMTYPYRCSKRCINDWCIQLPLIFKLFNKKTFFSWSLSECLFNVSHSTGKLQHKGLVQCRHTIWPCGEGSFRRVNFAFSRRWGSFVQLTIFIVFMLKAHEMKHNFLLFHEKNKWKNLDIN